MQNQATNTHTRTTTTWNLQIVEAARSSTPMPNTQLLSHPPPCPPLPSHRESPWGPPFPH